MKYGLDFDGGRHKNRMVLMAETGAILARSRSDALGQKQGGHPYPPTAICSELGNLDFSAIVLVNDLIVGRRSK
jgi:hypothetical protein